VWRGVPSSRMTWAKPHHMGRGGSASETRPRAQAIRISLGPCGHPWAGHTGGRGAAQSFPFPPGDLPSGEDSIFPQSRPRQIGGHGPLKSSVTVGSDRNRRQCSREARLSTAPRTIHSGLDCSRCSGVFAVVWTVRSGRGCSQWPGFCQARWRLVVEGFESESLPCGFGEPGEAFVLGRMAVAGDFGPVVAVEQGQVCVEDEFSLAWWPGKLCRFLV
jgi:hypothetical protein